MYNKTVNDWSFFQIAWKQKILTSEEDYVIYSSKYMFILHAKYKKEIKVIQYRIKIQFACYINSI